MHKTILRWLTLLMILAALTSATTWGVSLMRQPQHQEAKQKASGTKSKTLRETAAERDVETDASERHSLAEFKGDLSALAKGAHAIVIGRITGESASFTGDNFIDTYFTVEVRRVLKETDLRAAGVPLRDFMKEEEIGTPPPLATPLTVVRGGGVVHVAGHRASVNIKGRDLVATGKDYVLFLQWDTNYKAFHIIGGVSGAVLVENDIVRPLASEGKIKRRYDGANLETFIEEILGSDR